MKVGLSSYSLSRLIQSKGMDILDAIQWIADQGGEHVEITPFGFDLHGEDGLAESIREKAEQTGIEISNYAVGGNFITVRQEDYDKELERLIRDVDIAGRLGVKLMRHDVAFRDWKDCTLTQLEADMEKLVYACRTVADYAAPLGIVTSVENHGYYIQGSDRVQRLIDAVDRPNFKLTMDIGNYLCTDEDSAAAVQKNISNASMIHAKDFYIRPSNQDPGEGWFRSFGGSYLRGAIVGQGDIDIRGVLRTIKQSGYDGFISIEFEGMEDCLLGSRIGMDNVRRIWSELP
ncbi:sugar phosphate isomerase/epimerase family protein [Paenibacillus spongiae]|uniref:Sugar phosphate isomerase/epimerase n=1 Tax=Paenibacillus spongiae TaxID=2909671 RepID=A0ABY5SGZ2_9BACL|nr:sugar phosphate isomerase/epimerase family protein [Paenibacillus spongiae]UVI31992.1 sugar phosphate isomerase/epimerase [Paenibacillus spongiae]